MAESFLHAFAGDRIAAASTAVQSTDFDPIAGDVMEEAGADIVALNSKDVKDALKEHFSYVVTVCDASREKFPVWPFCRNIIHWDMIDPKVEAESTSQKKQVFRKVRDDIAQRVKVLIDQIPVAAQ